MKRLLKRVASKLPHKSQQELKRLWFHRQIDKQQFFTDEPEYSQLDRWLKPGDFAIDVGANVGHYTLRLAQLVGPSGRVFACEPVPDTFVLLASNVECAKARNVSLFNVAVTSESCMVAMNVPTLSTGLENFYQARITAGESNLMAYGMSIDSLGLKNKVALIKIDVEGHELPALKGMAGLLQRDRPVLVVEGVDAGVKRFLCELGYQITERNVDSPNTVFIAAVTDLELSREKGELPAQ